jgi:hypothetical protein
VLPIDGGEAQPLTRHATAVSHATWSSDGSAVYFLASDARTTEERERERVRDDVFPQSVEMYRAVVSHGVPSKLYVAPREGHQWAELRHQLAKANLELEWFERWVRERSYSWERAPGDVGAGAPPPPNPR